MIFRSRMNSNVLVFVSLCFAYCTARNAPDVSELALEIISQLSPALLQLQLSADELDQWNATVTDEHLLCVEYTIKEWFTRPSAPATSSSVQECSSALEDLLEPFFASGDGREGINDDDDDSESGSGGDYDEVEAMSLHAVTSVFCHGACGNVLLSAYSSCKLFDDALGKRVSNALVDLCSVNSNGEHCLEVLARSTFPAALMKCTANDCSENCKEGLEQVGKEIGCCVHLAEDITASELERGSEREDETVPSLSELFSSCKLQEVAECKESENPLKAFKTSTDVTDAALAPSSTALSVLVVCLVSLAFTRY